MIDAYAALGKVRDNKPLVHHITNWVTIYDCANITRSFGALPVMAHALLDSIEVLKNAVREFAERCVKGIVADGEQCRRYAEGTVAMATALSPCVGYAKAAEIVKEAVRTGKTIREVAAESGLLDPDLLGRLLDPRPLTEPGLPGTSKADK